MIRGHFAVVLPRLERQQQRAVCARETARETGQNQ
jgi:hypothetical protein